MKQFRLFLSIVLLATSFQLLAQDQTPTYRWFGDMRIRSEVDMRDFNHRTAANTYTLLRTRLGFEALPFENVRVFIQMRDSRVFGQERDATGAFSTLADTRNLDLHQGYVEIKKLFTDELTLRLGRQELSYANERLIGAVGWHNVGRSFDGGLLRLDFPALSLDLFAMNVGEVQSYTPVAMPPAVRYTTDRGSDFFGAYAILRNMPDHRIDGYIFYQWDRGMTTPMQRYTVGSYGRGKIGVIDYEAEVAYQFGERIDRDVSASMLTGALGYSFPNSVLSRISIGYESLSGTPVGDTKYKSFDPLYHTGHKFYGFMDYFISIPANTMEKGLTDLIVRATFTLSEKLTANVWLHNFAYAESVGGETALGQEVDFVALFRYNKHVSFEAGVSAFLPDHLMRQRFGGADTAIWSYLTAHVTF